MQTSSRTLARSLAELTLAGLAPGAVELVHLPLAVFGGTFSMIAPAVWIANAHTRGTSGEGVREALLDALRHTSAMVVGLAPVTAFFALTTSHGVTAQVVGFGVAGAFGLARAHETLWEARNGRRLDILPAALCGAAALVGLRLLVWLVGGV